MAKRTRTSAEDLSRYRYNPHAYIREKLGWGPWKGDAEHPGQAEVLDAYVLSLRQQHERRAYEAGELTVDQLHYWKPGMTIKTRFRIRAGHTVGKTKLASGLVNHFFDCFTPSIIYTFAPTHEQVKDLLWKEIRTDRRGKGLPGRILTLELERSDNHFAKGRATNNAGGQGTERAQGQHGEYLMFVIDEAEGVADFVFDAIDSMSSGGIVIVVMLANPRTRSSRFHKSGSLSSVESFRISCIHHPNVVLGREVVPGAVRREYVEDMLEKHAEEVAEHNPDHHTFEVPWRPGVIYKPDPEFMFRVLGEAPANVSDDTFVPVGRYEAACKRKPSGLTSKQARIGVDVARWGRDYGTIFTNHGGRLRRAAQLFHLDTVVYVEAIRAEAKRLAALGVESLHVRVDGGGGFGGGVVDLLRRDQDLRKLFKDFQVFEVNFNGVPYDTDAYADLITEIYAAVGELLKAMTIEKPPEALEADWCERRYTWVITRGQSVKKLEPKDAFKKRMNRSPDDGDGGGLASAPDHLFKKKAAAPPQSHSMVTF